MLFHCFEGKKKKEQYERERYMGKIDKIVLSVSHYRDRSRLCPFFREHMRQKKKNTRLCSEIKSNFTLTAFHMTKLYVEVRAGKGRFASP